MSKERRVAIERVGEKKEDSGWRELPPDIKLSLLDKREEIDATDKQLIALLAKRFQITSDIGEIKRAYDLPVLDRDRETALLTDRREAAKVDGLDPAFCEELFLNILRESRRNQENRLNEQR